MLVFSLGACGKKTDDATGDGGNTDNGGGTAEDDVLVLNEKIGTSDDFYNSIVSYANQSVHYITEKTEDNKTTYRVYVNQSDANYYADPITLAIITFDENGRLLSMAAGLPYADYYITDEDSYSSLGISPEMLYEFMDCCLRGVFPSISDDDFTKLKAALLLPDADTFKAVLNGEAAPGEYGFAQVYLTDDAGTEIGFAPVTFNYSSGNNQFQILINIEYF